MDRSSPITFIQGNAPFESQPLGGGATSTLGVAPPLARSASAREREAAKRRFREISTRVLNVALAASLLTLLLPVFLFIALAVRFSSKGPIIYSQDRVGLNQRQRGRRRGARRFGNDRRKGDRGGRIFKILKFRTMYMADSDAPQVWAKEGDPRVTPIGRFLRAHRLDELPQLFNVLRGDMNLVGPRPEQPEIFQELSKAIDAYPERQSVRPGITGWAQVNQQYDADLRDVRRKLHYDLQYVKRQSVSEDLFIMVKTPQVMIFKQGSR